MRAHAFIGKITKLRRVHREKRTRILDIAKEPGVLKILYDACCVRVYK